MYGFSPFVKFYVYTCILILSFYFEIYNNEATISGVNIVEVGRYKKLKSNKY